MSSINQKEYLKKYLGIGKALGEKKKKKRKEKTIGSRLKIVDDDIEASISQEIQDDLSATNEDAPLVVAVIDERPPSLRIDDETKNNLWKPIGEPANDASNLKLGSNFQLIKSKKDILIAQTKFRKPGNDHSLHTSQLRAKVKNEKHNDDTSPPRKRRFEGDSFEKHKDVDFSPPRKNRDSKRSKRYEDDSTNRIDENIVDFYSRKNNNGKKTENKDVDSFPQKNNYSTEPYNRNEDNYPRQQNRDDDISPPRKKSNSIEPNNRNDDNYPRQKTRDDDISPPRKRNSYTTESSNYNKDNYPRQKIRDDDISPPRNQKYINPKNIDHSPIRKIIREKDLHPMQQNKSHRNQNNSPPRYKNNYQDSSPKRNSEKFSPPRPIIKSKSCSSPYKGSTSEQGQKKSRWGSPERSHDTSDKVKVTLSGKRAGLQNAKEITKEIISLREKEDNMFSNMSEEISGINAATVVRDRVPRDLEEEALKLKKQKETKEKYDKWGKGLKQVQDHNEKMAEQLYEMSKPLARYADDEDLDKYLKEQEREGDPMLAYIRKKKRKKAIEAGVPEKPTYMGEFMPNRFGIKPGYRWDGVDRSNGYEKKWFEVQNKKKANLEEAHKWSTEDM